MNRMQERYQKEAVPALLKAFQYKNVMQVPRITKVVLNIGLGSEQDNAKALEAAMGDMTTITGQKPVMTKARTSIANFKLREGRIIGTKVTLRGDKMWAFLDRLYEYCSAARARLPWRFSGRIRRAWQLHAWSARPVDFPGDRIRQDRQIKRHGGHNCDHRQIR